MAKTMNKQEIIAKLQNWRKELVKWVNESAYLLAQASYDGDRLQAEQAREELERFQRDLALVDKRLADVKSNLQITRLQIVCRPEGNYLIATGKTIKSWHDKHGYWANDYFNLVDDKMYVFSINRRGSFGDHQIEVYNIGKFISGC